MDRVQEAKEQLCAVRGHSQSWRVEMDEASREPVEIACSECGRTYRVEPLGKPRPLNREYTVEFPPGEGWSARAMARRGGVPDRVLNDYETEKLSKGMTRYTWRWVGEL